MTDNKCHNIDISETDIEINTLESGLQGRAFERLPDGSIGQTLPGVRIVFVREDGHIVRSTITNSTGYYRVNLGVGRYFVVATHANYQIYNTFPGFSVVTGYKYQTHNIFLKKLISLIVLLLRHAEADYPADPVDPPLTITGKARAQELVRVVEKVGVNAIYATELKRTKLTVQPLAEALGITIQEYPSTDVQGTVARVLAINDGDKVLIAGHSNTVPFIINEFGAEFPTTPISDFDNLFVLTYDTGKVTVVNLQYGESSP